LGTEGLQSWKSAGVCLTTSVIRSALLAIGVGGETQGFQGWISCGGMPSLETWDEGWFKDGAVA